MDDELHPRDLRQGGERRTEVGGAPPDGRERRSGVDRRRGERRHDQGPKGDAS